MAGHTNLDQVKSGACDLDDLLKLNALMDHHAAQDHAAAEAAKRGS